MNTKPKIDKEKSKIFLKALYYIVFIRNRKEYIYEYIG